MMELIQVKIEIVRDPLFGYTVLVDGEVLLECLSEADVDELTLAEIKTFARSED